MAIIILGGTTCSICGNILQESEDIVGWSSFLTKEHQFWEYSDSGMHRSCFENWENKDEFEALYRYKPLVDFDDPALKEQIKKQGMPDWLKEIEQYRRNI